MSQLAQCPLSMTGSNGCCVPQDFPKPGCCTIWVLYEMINGSKICGKLYRQRPPICLCPFPGTRLLYWIINSAWVVWKYWLFKWIKTQHMLSYMWGFVSLWREVLHCIVGGAGFSKSPCYTRDLFSVRQPALGNFWMHCRSEYSSKCY